MPPNKDSIATKETAYAPCRLRWGLRKMETTRGKPKTKTQMNPMNDTEQVFVVKMEVHTMETGHPLFIESKLAVEEVYRSKQSAIARMRELATADSCLQIAWARAARNRHSEAWLNAIPPMDRDADSIQVTTVNRMINRYFVEAIAILP